MKIRTGTLIALLALSLAACGNSGKNPADKTSEPQAAQNAVKKPMTKAELETKAAAGDKNAQFELGALYHDGEGIPKDLVKARQWFEKAAAQNEARAQFNLGVMYYTGESVTQNYAKAKNYFEQAAEQNNPRAEFNLGVMYYRGEGVKQDFTQAYKIFEMAGVQNFAEAQFNLGVMNAKGEGREQDIGKAYAWFVLSRENGNPRASEVIGNIERELKPDQREIAKSLTDDLRKQIAALRAKALSGAK